MTTKPKSQPTPVPTPKWMLDSAAEFIAPGTPPGMAEHLKELYAARIALHYAAREREEWIPVSERLPEEGEKVIAVESDGGMELNWIPYSNSVPESQRGKWSFANTFVTHWRPLPAAPAPFAAKGETGSVAAQGDNADRCLRHPFGTRVCERGTKGCNVQHAINEHDSKHRNDR